MYYSTTATRFEFRSSRESKLQALESTAKTPPLAKTQRKLVPPLQQLQLLEMVLRKLCWLSNGKLYCDTAMGPETSARSSREGKLCYCAFVGIVTWAQMSRKRQQTFPFCFLFWRNFAKKRN
jgi:hypothetical protein